MWVLEWGRTKTDRCSSWPIPCYLADTTCWSGKSVAHIAAVRCCESKRSSWYNNSTVYRTAQSSTINHCRRITKYFLLFSLRSPVNLYTFTSWFFTTPFLILHTLSYTLTHQYIPTVTEIGCCWTQRSTIYFHISIGYTTKSTTINRCKREMHTVTAITLGTFLD